MYQHYTSIVDISMSSDADCQTLRSPKIGSLVLELAEGKNPWRHSVVCNIKYIYCKSFHHFILTQAEPVYVNKQ